MVFFNVLFFLFKGNNIHCMWLLASSEIMHVEVVIIMPMLLLGHRMTISPLSRPLISYGVFETHGAQSLMDFQSHK